MTGCEGIAGFLDQIASRYPWECSDLDTGSEVATGRYRADGEPIMLRLRLDEQSLMASDGGETLSALAQVGLDLSDPVHDGLWRHALQQYRLSEIEGRVFVQLPEAEAAYGLNRFADALVALDALRLVAIPARSRPRTLAGEVEQYLREQYSDARVRTRPTVRLAGGLRVTPGFAVETADRGEVLVQPGAATSITQSYDHAFATFSLAGRGGVPIQRRLTILGGSVATWNASRLRALSEVTFIGFWSHRDRIRLFLDGQIPDDPLMAPPGIDVPMLP